MRNVMLRHFIITYTIYFIGWIIVLAIYADSFDY